MQHTQRIVPTSACTSGATGALSGAGWGTSSPTPSGTHARLHARVAQRHDKTTRAGYSTCEPQHARVDTRAAHPGGVRDAWRHTSQLTQGDNDGGFD